MQSLNRLHTDCIRVCVQHGYCERYSWYRFEVDTVDEVDTEYIYVDLTGGHKKQLIKTNKNKGNEIITLIKGKREKTNKDLWCWNNMIIA